MFDMNNETSHCLKCSYSNKREIERSVNIDNYPIKQNEERRRDQDRTNRFTQC